MSRTIVPGELVEPPAAAAGPWPARRELFNIDYFETIVSLFTAGRVTEVAMALRRWFGVVHGERYG
jgi:hypothetical protein